MKVTSEKLKESMLANSAFLEFFNSVYGDADWSGALKDAFMEVAYLSWLAGSLHSAVNNPSKDQDKIN